jgi:hypothetical protein
LFRGDAKPARPECDRSGIVEVDWVVIAGRDLGWHSYSSIGRVKTDQETPLFGL